MRRLAGIWLLGLSLAVQAAAGVGVWTPVGGPEPPFARLLVDPVRPQTLYALVNMVDPENAGALWKSTDGGATWRSSQEGLGVPLDLLAIDPLQPERLYGWQTIHYPDSSTPKLWLSEDGGATWTERYSPGAQQDGPYFWQLVPSPLQAGVLYAWEDSAFTGASGGAAVYRSTDRGATWQHRGAVGSSRSAIETLSHHPTRDRLEFFDHRTFYASDDGGVTWLARGTFRGQGFRAVSRSAAAPDRLYALPSNIYPCLVRSDDGGASWRRLGSPALPGPVICSDVAVDPHDPDLVRVLARGQVGRRSVTLLATSRDGGVSWERPRPLPASGLFAANTLEPTPDDPETLYAAGSYTSAAPGPFRSTDGGRSWSPSWEGIASGDLRTGLVAVPGFGPGPLLFSIAQAPGVAGGRVVRSADRGATWETLPLAATGLAADAGGRILYALRADDGRVMKSSDAGATWAEAAPDVSLEAILADPYRPGRVFTANAEEEAMVTVWRTADTGATWARRSAGLPVLCTHFASVDYCPWLNAVTSDPRDPDRVLIAFGQELVFNQVPIYLSTDGGRRWQRAAQSPPGVTLSFAADPDRPGVFLAGTQRGIFRSEDGGNHWTAVQPGLPNEATVWQLLRDGHTGAWYAVTDIHGVFRSTDGGNTWTGINAGLPDFAAPRAVIDPQTPGRLFLAVRGQGLWSWRAPGS